MDAHALAALEPIRPLRRREFERLVDAGAFDGERVELLWGMLVNTSPQGAPHAWTIHRLSTTLAAAVGERAHVRVQMPLAAGEDAEPEPDIAIVAASDEWRRRHPDRAWLVVEVARTSQRLDRQKLSLYAPYVDEVWLVDLPAERVEVYTSPVGDRYGRLVTVGRGDTLAVGAFPDVRVDVAAILP